MLCLDRIGRRDLGLATSTQEVEEVLDVFVVTPVALPLFVPLLWTVAGLVGTISSEKGISTAA